MSYIVNINWLYYMGMIINIIINNESTLKNDNPKSVSLTIEEWVYICEECMTWEVFKSNLPKNKLICWFCLYPYEKYNPQKSYT